MSTRRLSFEYGSMRDIWGYGTCTSSTPCHFHCNVEVCGVPAVDGPPEENRNIVQGLSTDIPRQVSVNPMSAEAPGTKYSMNKGVFHVKS